MQSTSFMLGWHWGLLASFSPTTTTPRATRVSIGPREGEVTDLLRLPL